jgi:hypothetical protein
MAMPMTRSILFCDLKELERQISHFVMVHLTIFVSSTYPPQISKGSMKMSKKRI